MIHSSISPEDRAKEGAAQLKINPETLKDAFRILDMFQRIVRNDEFPGEWPDFDKGAGSGGMGREGELHIPHPNGRKWVGTGVSVNVIPRGKRPRGKCRDILFVHVKKNANRSAQLEIMNQTGRHVKTCRGTKIVIFHGTLNYYVWDETRHQLEGQLVFLQPIKHSWLVLDPDWW
uniref:Uncharacterized protein n=1 Tax=uncultured marine thaumarchaeote AD1000_02_C08 TaxID=1455880 RepID=A0A075FGA7_9ARCH|nr:hypothetical protein [uncultured marine thaumarchaeote AD1000_02_C08]